MSLSCPFIFVSSELPDVLVKLGSKSSFRTKLNGSQQDFQEPASDHISCTMCKETALNGSRRALSQYQQISSPKNWMTSISFTTRMPADFSRLPHRLAGQKTHLLEAHTQLERFRNHQMIWWFLQENTRQHHSHCSYKYKATLGGFLQPSFFSYFRRFNRGEVVCPG